MPLKLQKKKKNLQLQNLQNSLFQAKAAFLWKLKGFQTQKNYLRANQFLRFALSVRTRHLTENVSGHN